MRTDQSYLRAREIIASDLYQAGKITRCECFRIEMDAALGENTGDIRYQENNEYQEWLADGNAPIYL